MGDLAGAITALGGALAAILGAFALVLRQQRLNDKATRREIAQLRDIDLLTGRLVYELLALMSDRDLPPQVASLRGQIEEKRIAMYLEAGDQAPEVRS